MNIFNQCIFNILLLFSSILFSHCSMFKYSEKTHEKCIINKKIRTLRSDENLLLLNLEKTIIKMLNNIDTTLYRGNIFIYNTNNSNYHYLNNKNFKNIIEQTIINNSNTLKLINKKKVALLKKQIKFSSKDSLSLKNKILVISKKIGIKYILFYEILGNIHSNIIHIELINVYNTEIIWRDFQFLPKK